MCRNPQAQTIMIQYRKKAQISTVQRAKEQKNAEYGKFTHIWLNNLETSLQIKSPKNTIN
jgi:hypothetical protein